MNPPTSQHVRPPGIELRAVGVIRAERWIVRDVDWSVPAGGCAAILGPNGSGKSTLARVLSGYIWPSRGEVSIDGNRFGETDLNELRESIRLVQPAGPFDAEPELTALELVLTGLHGTIGFFANPSHAEEDRAAELLGRVGLGKVIGHRYSTLSSGERVRAHIARALMRTPRLLLLDEPTAGLDLLGREQVLATIDALMRMPNRPTVVMVTHHIEELNPGTSHVLLLRDGTVAASGTMSEVLRGEVLSPVYGLPVHVDRAGERYYVRIDPAAWRGFAGE